MTDSGGVRIATDCAGVDWAEAARVFELAPLGTREPDALRRSFENSAQVRFAWDGERLVGLGRAISDGVFQAAIYDLCLLPEYQGRGLGGRLLDSLMAACEGLTVTLFSVPGKEGFYARRGFGRMRTGLARFADPERMLARGYLEDLAPSRRR